MAGRAAPALPARRLCRSPHHKGQRWLPACYFGRYTSASLQGGVRLKSWCLTCVRKGADERASTAADGPARRCNWMGDDPVIAAARMVAFADAHTTSRDRGDGWRIAGVRVTPGDERRLYDLRAGKQAVCTLRFADQFCVRHGLPLDVLLDDSPIVAPRSRQHRPRPCPCGCGTADGFCDTHRAELHRIRAELFGGDRRGSHIPSRDRTPKTHAPTCCNPWCFQPRERGHAFCDECERAGWTEDTRE